MLSPECYHGLLSWRKGAEASRSSSSYVSLGLLAPGEGVSEIRQISSPTHTTPPQNCCHPHLEEEGTDYGDPTEKESNAGVTTAVKENVFI